MTFTVTISLDNAAFDDQPLEEVSRVLAEQAKKLHYNRDATSWSDTLTDVNGNVVGKAEWKPLGRASNDTHQGR